MEKIRTHITFLYNGGLDPQLAAHPEVRSRRLFFMSVLAITPVVIVVMLSNIYYEATGDNTIIVMGMGIIYLSLYVQAYFDSPNLATNMSLLAYWLMITVLASKQGVLGTTTFWLLPLPCLAILVVGKGAGVAWCVVCAITIYVTGFLELSGLLPSNKLISSVVIPEFGSEIVDMHVTESITVLIILTVATMVSRIVQESAERELGSTVRSLKNEVQIRTLAEQDAKRSEETKSAFLAAMSHELRTPLNGIIGASNLLLRSRDPDESREYTRTIIDSGETLLELINNVMDLSYLEAGKVELERIPLDIEDLVRRAVAPFQFHARKKNIAIKQHFAADLPRLIYGDPVRLRQVILNLLGNALKFTEAGEIRIEVSASFGAMEISVIDTGIGMSEQAVARIFEPYVQADLDTMRKYGGSGLGLTIVKKLVTTMGGKIDVSSQPGSGSEFKVFLPYEEAQPSVAQEPEVEVQKLPSLSVLVADDNAVNRMVLTRMLERDDHHVVTAVNGNEALEYASNNKVDIILMDIQMPDMDGLEAAQRIRSLDDEHSLVPIVAITANTSEGDVDRALSAGMNSFIGKPFRYEELLLEMESALR